MSMIKNSIIASAAILLCRLTGLIRVRVFTSLFGASGFLDAFYVAFRIPNLLRDLLAEGAMSQSYTSVAAKVKEKEGDLPAWEVTNKVATQLVALLSVIVLIGIMVSGPLMEILYEESPSAEVMGLAVDLCKIMWPFILFASISALTMGTLNILGIFGLPMLASAAFNIVTVVAGFIIAYLIEPSFLVDPKAAPKALYGFAIAVVLGGFAQWAVQLPTLRKKGFRWKANFKWKDKNIYKIWGLMLPAVLSSGTTQFNVLINNGFALKLEQGSVTALTTAFQLWQLPVGLFGVATGMVVLPAISRMMVTDGKKEIAEHIAKALRFVAFLAVPSFIVLAILGEETVSVIFQSERFDASAVKLTGNVLASYSLGLLGYAGTKVVQPIFLALEKRWVPLIASLIALYISVSLNYYFVMVLHKDASWLALTTSVITTFNFLFYFIYLRNQLGGMCGKTLLSGLLKILGAAIPFALICLFSREYFMQDFTNWSFIYRALVLTAVVTAGGISYLAFSWIFKTPELEAFKNKFLKKSGVR